MKRKSIIALLLTFVMSMSIFAASCSKKPETIEEYVNNNQEEMEEVKKTADESGLAIDFSGNDVIYSMDLASMEGVTEDIVKSDVMKDNLVSALEGLTDRFTGLCGQLEEQSGIKGAQIIVNYTYGDEVIVTKTFNSSGMVE